MKQLLGTLAVAALLAVVAVLGLVALGQSNSRGAELRRLQEQGGYEQLLLTDATQLRGAIGDRLDRQREAYQLGDYTALWVLSTLNSTIGRVANRLCLDAGFKPVRPPSLPTEGKCIIPESPPHLPLTLHAVAPRLSRKLRSFGGPAVDGLGNTIPLLWVLPGRGVPQGPLHPLYVRGYKWAASFAAQLAVLTRETEARASALVASDRRSYTHSRNLLIGAGAGSLLLALALGLLLSDSLLIPLHKTQRRLAAIATGDFSGELEVPNRDELGALASDVNKMSDELLRVYRELELASERKSEYLALRNLRLDSQLQASLNELQVQADELRASRARVVAAADAERRRIERDLHDGAQQYLAGVAVNLRAALSLVDSDREKAKAILDELHGSTTEAQEAFRDLAHGVYPPLLQDRGLTEALADAARRAPVATRVETPALRRFDPEVEAAIYFCCLEALQNVGKHAGEQALAFVRVWEEARGLLFEVADDGVGLAPEGGKPGAGITNMRDRLGAIGGNLRFESSIGHGTRVIGTIPLNT